MEDAMSVNKANDATVAGDASRLLMSRVLAVIGHDLNLSIGRADEEGPAAAACRLNIALYALKRMLRILDGMFVPAKRSELNRGIA
jgi:hypothetical protein